MLSSVDPWPFRASDHLDPFRPFVDTSDPFRHLRALEIRPFRSLQPFRPQVLFERTLSTISNLLGAHTTQTSLDFLQNTDCTFNFQQVMHKLDPLRAGYFVSTNINNNKTKKQFIIPNIIIIVGMISSMGMIGRHD